MPSIESLKRLAFGPLAVRAFDLAARRRIYPTYQALMRSQWQSPAEIRHGQEEALDRILTHAWMYSPYYRQRLDATGWLPGDGEAIALLDRLPALEKTDLQYRLEEVSTVGRWDGGRPTVWSTGGSTGVATRVYIDTHTRDCRQAVQFRNMSWLGVRPGDPIAYLGGTSLGIPAAASIRHRLESAAKRQTFLPAWDLSNAALAAHADRLAHVRPRLLIGYSGAVHALAAHMVRTGRQVPVPAVLCTGEMLLDHWRPMIEKAFATTVFDRYGSIEVGDIAHGCARCGRMHVNDEQVILRTDPETGDLLITDLTTFATPLINYRIGDRVTLSESPAPCGRGLRELVRIEGRSTDVLELPNGRSISGMVFSFTPGDTPGVTQYQVWQPTPDRLQVVVTCDGEFRHRQILGELQSVFPEVAIEIYRVDAIAPNASGKRPLIVKGRAFPGEHVRRPDTLAAVR